MVGKDWLTTQFEAERDRLRRVAYRMLGSASEAEDAVQEAWLRLSRAGTDEVRNLGGWLTTVVARVCLDMLRGRRSRREEPLEAHDPGAAPGDPEQEAALADSVGLALLVVLQTLAPAERVAFVLHDMFAMPFDEIASIVGNTPAAARQMASRARRRVQGKATVPEGELARQRRVVDAFLAAARNGDFQGLLAVLDPDIVLRADAAAVAVGATAEVHGAVGVAQGAMRARARFARAALVDGAVGVIVAPSGQLRLVMSFTVANDKVVAIEVVAEPARLARLNLAVLDDGAA